MIITLKVPDIYFTTYNQYDISKQIKIYTALMMFHTSQISIGAACEIAELDRFSFLAECKKNKISVINYSINDVKSELAQFQL